MKLFIISIFVFLLSTNMLGQAKKTQYPNNWYLTKVASINQPYGSLWYIHNHEVTLPESNHEHAHDHHAPMVLPSIKKEVETANKQVNLSLGLLNTKNTTSVVVELIALDGNKQELGTKEVVLESGSALQLYEINFRFNNTKYQAVTIIVKPKTLNKDDELYVNLINL